MLENRLIYKETKRNELCPCGSGKTFKKCCMKEYRAAKKIGAKLSCFTPIPPLESEFSEKFTKFYTDLMIFSHQHKNNSDIIMIENEEQNMQGFVQQEREYFYENRESVINAYLLKKSPSNEELELLDALKDAFFDEFFLLSKEEESAVIISKDEKLYNIKALNLPFTEIFNQGKKYLGIRTSLIAYKNCYFTDGVYDGFNTSREMNEYFDNVPYKNPMIHYKKNSITNIPLVLNFAIGCDLERFEEMEEILLKKIPEDFAKSFLRLFKNPYSLKEQLIASFMRSTDLENELNTQEGEQTFAMIIGGTPVTSFENYGDRDVIPYDILEKYYKQKPLKESSSKTVYENVKGKNSELNDKDVNQTSFYTMIGILHVDQDEVDNLIEFLKTFSKKKRREEIMFGLNNFFSELSDEVEFDITAVFLGLGIDLDFIYHDIEDYREYVKKNKCSTLHDMQQYAYRR
ncbi:MAG: SEC-C domain-containing protein [Sulfurimonas sp.]|nr:SEC-C domain-containing protein [Sulfurimonas sp.]